MKKPIGAYDPTDTPSWITFGAVPSWIAGADLDAAIERSHRTGFKWIVQFGFDCSPLEPIGPRAALDVARLSALWPHVAAVTYGEEWEARFWQNEFAPLGFPATTPNGPAIVQAWTGAQQGALRIVTNRPVLWVAPGVQRVPANTDYVALDQYVPDGVDPVAHLGPFVAQAEAETALPLVLIPRWFSCGPTHEAARAAFGQPPSARMADAAAAILSRPRWIAALGWLAQSRPASDVRGMNDIPGGWDTIDAAFRAHGII